MRLVPRALRGWGGFDVVVGAGATPLPEGERCWQRLTGSPWGPPAWAGRCQINGVRGLDGGDPRGGGCLHGDWLRSAPTLHVDGLHP